MRLKASQLLTAYLPALLMDFAFSSLLTNTSFYTSHLRLSNAFLGGLMAVTTAFFATLAIPFGRLSDRGERRWVLYLACLLIGAVSIGLPFCRSRLHLLLIFPGVGIGMALFWPAYEAWLAEREGEGELIHRVMLFNLFWSIGITLGPAAAGYLYRDANPFTPFYLAGIFSVLTGGTIFSNKPNPAIRAGASEAETAEPVFPPPAVRTTYLHVARCANFASWFALGVLRRLAPKLILEMGPRRQSFRKSDAHPWWRANLNLHRARWRIFNPVALSARTPPHRPSVGDYQLHRHLAGSACNFMGVCLCRYRCVCRLHLFQQPLLRLGPARR